MNPRIALHGGCRREEGGRGAIRLRNLYKVYPKPRISVRKPSKNCIFSRAFGAIDSEMIPHVVHQPRHMAAETTHEGVSLEGTKAASLAQLLTLTGKRIPKSDQLNF